MIPVVKIDGAHGLVHGFALVERDSHDSEQK